MDAIAIAPGSALPWPLVLFLALGSACGGGVGVAAWASTAMHAAAAHPIVQSAASRGIVQLASAWTSCTGSWSAWRWSLAAVGALASLAAAFVAGAVCGGAMAWASSHLWPRCRDMPDTLAALSALAEQLEDGGPSAAEAAASHLGLPDRTGLCVARALASGSARTGGSSGAATRCRPPPLVDIRDSGERWMRRRILLDQA